MPRCFETEEGPRPELDREYRAVEVGGGYRERTQANARDSDGTVWFGDPASPGGKTTLRTCNALARPVFIVRAGITRPSDLATWLIAGYVEVLNVAGNRESTEPGLGSHAERFLVATLERLIGTPHVSARTRGLCRTGGSAMAGTSMTIQSTYPEAASVITLVTTKPIEQPGVE